MITVMPAPHSIRIPIQNREEFFNGNIGDSTLSYFPAGIATLTVT